MGWEVVKGGLMFYSLATPPNRSGPHKVAQEDTNRASCHMRRGKRAGEGHHQVLVCKLATRSHELPPSHHHHHGGGRDSKKGFVFVLLLGGSFSLLLVVPDAGLVERVLI